MAAAAGILNHAMTAGQALTGKAATPMDSTTTGTSGTSSSSDASSDSATISANDFLTLLVTEMQNQDPTADTDPNEYINQLVQVNSLEQLIDINQTLRRSSWRHVDRARATGHRGRCRQRRRARPAQCEQLDGDTTCSRAHVQRVALRASGAPGGLHGGAESRGTAALPAISACPARIRRHSAWRTPWTGERARSPAARRCFRGPIEIVQPELPGRMAAAATAGTERGDGPWQVSSIPLTGLEADSTALNTIANDLSNMNTTAFKAQTTNFSDLFYQQIGSTGTGDPIQVGAGVQVASNETDFTQGSYQLDRHERLGHGH